MLQNFKFSRRQLKDASRLAIQAAIAAAVLFIVMQALKMPEKFVGVISAVLVLSPGVGGTLTSAWKRFAATLIGVLVGIACLWTIPGGYGTAVALAVSMLVMNAIAGLFPQWQYGVVAAVALALGSEGDLLQVSIDRSLSIGLGVFIGSIVSVIVWPQTSEKRADAFIRDALKDTRKILSLSLAETQKELSTDTISKLTSLENSFSSMISAARNTASDIRFADNSDIMDRIEAITFLHNSILIINKIAEDEDRIQGEDDKFLEFVEQVQEEIEAILEDLIDRSEKVSQETIDKIGTKVEEIRDLAAEDEDRKNWHHTHRVSLAYALSEVVLYLGKLRESYVSEKS
ncbi:MAG: FUSC family protein [Luteolibacter sp.]